MRRSRGRDASYLTSLLFLAVVVQVGFTRSAPLGFLHGINALAIYALAALLAHRAWTQRT